MSVKEIEIMNSLRCYCRESIWDQNLNEKKIRKILGMGNLFSCGKISSCFGNTIRIEHCHSSKKKFALETTRKT